MRIEWTRLAEADLRSIFAYIKNDSPNSAVRVIAAIRRTVRSQLPMTPYAGRIGRVRGTRELVVPRLPYTVAYRVSDSSVQILRVLHGAQRWPKSL